MDQLDFSSFLNVALSGFRRYNSRTQYIAKKHTNSAGRYIQQSTHINNYVHLGMYLGNVLYCRFPFMDQHDFQRIFERALLIFGGLTQVQFSNFKKPTRTLQVGRCIRSHTKKIVEIQVCTQVIYSIVSSHLWICIIFTLSLRGALVRFRPYNSCTLSIKKAYKNCRQVHTIEHTHKQSCTFRYESK